MQGQVKKSRISDLHPNSLRTVGSSRNKSLSLNSVRHGTLGNIDEVDEFDKNV